MKDDKRVKGATVAHVSIPTIHRIYCTINNKNNCNSNNSSNNSSNNKRCNNCRSQCKKAISNIHNYQKSSWKTSDNGNSGNMTRTFRKHDPEVDMSKVHHNQQRRRRRTAQQTPYKLLLRLQVYPTFRLLPVLWLLLCYCCCCCHCDHLPHAIKLSNCFDMRYSFEEQVNGTAAQLLQLPTNGNGSGSSNGTAYASHSPNGNKISNGIGANNNSAIANATSGDMWQQQHLSASAGTFSLRGTPMMHSGWQCCCWNATNHDEIECHCQGEALTRVPQTLNVPMQRLTISSAGLPRVRSTGLKKYAESLQDVILIDLQNLECIEDGAFAGLKLLRTIYISHAPKLTFLPRDVFAGISETIKTIRIINSGLTRIPDLIHMPTANILQMIDLDSNQITRIDTKSINVKTDELILANNEISYIDDSAFYGSQIAKLILRQNRKLEEVHPNAFNGISMHELDLSGTSLVRLPSVGLEDIEELRIQNTHTLKTIPSIYNFKNLQRAYLTHSFHCCAFKFPSRHDPVRHAERMKEIEKWQLQCTKNGNGNGNAITDNLGRVMRAKETDASVWTKNGQAWDTNGSKANSKHGNGNGNADDDGVFYSRLAQTDFYVSNEINESTESDGYMAEEDYMSESMIKEIGIFHEEITINPDSNQLDEYCGNFTFRKNDVECYPMPNALNPCEDVMGYQWLRISVWIVVALAVVGNVAVLVVILSIKSESPSVPRFLMCHLAFADLCLGLYLLLIAAIDAHSMGEYFNYAYDWQYGAGCKVAGFLTVFASHLSVFTLTVITIERWMAITHAMYLNKRIKLKAAGYIMAGGWAYSMVMSMMPLFGISNYSSTSICLPMEIRDCFAIVYLVAILGINGGAFCVISICYAQIYLSLGKETRHAHSQHRGEMTIARKMALLVFTNFSCWAPIAFFGLTALAGYPLINVTKSKILLVFFYPLNSCADPYLYAILTSQYRQDLYTLLSKFGLCKQSAMKYKNSLSMPYSANMTGGTGLQHHNSSLVNKQPELQLMLHKHEEFV